MDTTKDRSRKDLTEAEEMKRWHGCTNELHTKKGLNDPDNHDGVADRREKVEAMTFYFLGLQNHCGK